MPIYPSLIAFIFGTLVGSFLNVVAIRYNTGSSINGRSKCMTCGKKLSWYELIPLFSFLAQKGTCRGCKSKISWQYPLVEFIAGAIFVLLFIQYPPTSIVESVQTIMHIVMACMLLLVTVYDIKHKIIPDHFVYTFNIFAFALLFFNLDTWWQIPTFNQVLAGPIIAMPFLVLWLISRGEWMGLGDGKLAFGIGWLLGIAGGVNALILAFWIGAAVSIIWIFIAFRKFKPKMEIPFGPYLILGMYIVLLFGVKIIDFEVLKGIIGSLIN